MLSSTLMMRPYASSIAPLRRFEVATGARVDLAAKCSPGVGGGLPRAPCLASVRHMGSENISQLLAPAVVGGRSRRKERLASNKRPRKAATAAAATVLLFDPAGKAANE
jgi:hypothetical protein